MSLWTSTMQFWRQRRKFFDKCQKCFARRRKNINQRIFFRKKILFVWISFCTNRMQLSGNICDDIRKTLLHCPRMVKNYTFFKKSSFLQNFPMDTQNDFFYNLKGNFSKNGQEMSLNAQQRYKNCSFLIKISLNCFSGQVECSFWQPLRYF